MAAIASAGTLGSPHRLLKIAALSSADDCGADPTCDEDADDADAQVTKAVV